MSWRCPSSRFPQGVKVAEAFTDFKTNLRSSYTARGSDYLAELYPTLTYDPNKKLDAGVIEKELGVTDDTGDSVTIEGMPIGVFENELTVQLWQPVTIRGYTFNVGDNVTLDQTKVEKTPAVGGDFAWLFATYQAERTGNPFESFWNRLPPPLLREGNKVQTPWLTGVLERPAHDPPGGPVADAAVPLRQVGRRPRRTRPRSWPTTSPRAIGRSSRIRRSPSRTRATWRSATRPIPIIWRPAG